jgi:ABC-type polysaccharide/polyol phosphate transport system ATPase subunit
MVSHHFETLNAYCARGAVLQDGRVVFYDTVAEAWAAHETAQRRAGSAQSHSHVELANSGRFAAE